MELFRFALRQIEANNKDRCALRASANGPFNPGMLGGLMRRQQEIGQEFSVNTRAGTITLRIVRGRRVGEHETITADEFLELVRETFELRALPQNSFEKLSRRLSIQTRRASAIVELQTGVRGRGIDSLGF